MIELPELPPPAIHGMLYPNHPGFECPNLYTAAQMQAYGRACAAAALEAASKVCEARVVNESGMNRENFEVRQCARAIRALMGEQK